MTSVKLAATAGLPRPRGRQHKSAVVRSRPRLIVLLSAWLLATGVHWDALQVVAWSRMFADNARSMPLLAAVRQTFDPQKMCGMCCAVQAAKREQRESTSPAAQVEGKAPVVIQPAAGIVVAAPAGRPWRVEESAVEDAEREAPPVPPPRVRV